MTLKGRLYYPQVLIITGSGRHVGKTTLACAIINALASSFEVTALKISPHFHPVNYDRPIYEEKERYAIYEEQSLQTAKDSSKMKLAGASQVYYIQATKENTEKAFLKGMELIDLSRPVICESGILLNFVKPGLALYVKKSDTDHIIQHKNPEIVELVNDGENFKIFISNITYNSGYWRLNREKK